MSHPVRPPSFWVQTASGRAVDLLHPHPSTIDFHIDVPEQLARIARFAGAVRSGPYSVAQHCVMGADALYDETHDRERAACFLLHDAHEAYVGDIISPVAAFLNDSGALGNLKERLDRAIFEAAGGDISLRNKHIRAIDEMDIRMLSTERAHLLVRSPHAWHPRIEAARPLRLRGKFKVWTWPDAADLYRDRVRRYLPGLIDTPNPRRKPGFIDTVKRHLTPNP